MKSFYRNSNNLSEATRKIAHHLYGEKGIIILDSNRPELKTLFLPTIEQELKLQTSYNEVLKTNQVLSQQKYKIQVNPREINLFYKKNGVRERILKTEHGYKINNSNLAWSNQEFHELINNNPGITTKHTKFCMLIKLRFSEFMLKKFGIIKSNKRIPTAGLFKGMIKFRINNKFPTKHIPIIG